MYVLLDPGASLSFVTPYLAVNFDVSFEILVEPFSVSTLVGKSIIARWVYRNFLIKVSQKITLVDLVELEMTDFDVIFGLDWLHSCYDSVGCRNRVVQFQFPNEPVIYWMGSTSALRG